MTRIAIIAIALTVGFIALFDLGVSAAHADTNKKVVLENAEIRVERIMQLSGTEAAREANPNWFTHSCVEGQKMVNETIDKAVAQYPMLERKLTTLLTQEPTTYSKKDGGCSWGRWTAKKATSKKARLIAAN